MDLIFNDDIGWRVNSLGVPGRSSLLSWMNLRCLPGTGTGMKVTPGGHQSAEGSFLAREQIPIDVLAQS